MPKSTIHEYVLLLQALKAGRRFPFCATNAYQPEQSYSHLVMAANGNYIAFGEVDGTSNGVLNKVGFRILGEGMA